MTVYAPVVADGYPDDSESMSTAGHNVLILATMTAMSAARHTNGESAAFGRVVFVASMGGIHAFTTVLAALPAGFPAPVVVAQHRKPLSDGGDVLAAVLAQVTSLPVRLAENGACADEPGITVVPAGAKATINADRTWSLTRHSPNAGVGDVVLASSAAQTPTIAVILTGRLADGATGCRAVKRNRGRVLVQQPAQAAAPGMPTNALATGCADFVLPLDHLAAAVVALTTAPGAAELLAVPLPPWANLAT